MYIDKNVIDELKKSSDIVNIISEYINLTKKGANYIGLCPFHQDTKPSLYVSPEKKVYKCFSCNKGGDVISFVQQIKKIWLFKCNKICCRKI